MNYNAGNRQDVRRLEKQAKIEDAARKEVVNELMSTEAGRTWMHDRLSNCHLFSTSFSLTALETAFKEGERNQGLQLLNDVMSSCPDQYVQMMREANVRHELSNTRFSRSDRTDPDGGDSGSDFEEGGSRVAGSDLDEGDYN
jgi:hypothetical protein